ncbi:MAG TPA: type II secretion system protein GspE, partial [Firmicutes bacterium]|nr:type II secretion system protein GspE [Bacillota bacterium]
MSKKLGEILIENGIISEEQLQNALILQKSYNVPLGHILIEMKLATQAQIVEALSQQYRVPYVSLVNYDIEAENVTLVPAKLVQHYNMIPFDLQSGKLLIAASNPSNIEGLDAIRKVAKREITVFFAYEEEIKFVYNRFFEEKRLTEDIQMLGTGVVEPAAQEIKAAVEEALVNDTPVVKLVNTLFSNAFRNHASDIHIEPDNQHLRIRFRIDGALYETMKDVSLVYHAQIISRIKILADLDIAEKRIPQDGRVSIEIDNQKADLRVSIIPTTFGEKAVLRILYKQTQFLSLDGLGLTAKDLQDIEDILTFPNGLIYTSGPTGSGKTTTLYAFLHQLNSAHKNLMTLEDPIEYIFPGVTQVNVYPKVGLTFANGLRSFLRQDPDIIMVGETRDQETAQITVQAALTGHLVLSTIHANDAVTVVTRLMNMDIEPYLIASALVGVIAQRLVRKICSKCIEPMEVSEKYRELYSLGENNNYFYGKGCDFCHNTGYSGRIG